MQADKAVARPGVCTGSSKHSLLANMKNGGSCLDAFPLQAITSNFVVFYIIVCLKQMSHNAQAAKQGRELS